MSSHLIDNEFQSDKYPTCPRGKVPLSVKDPMAQDLLWQYAQRHRAIDAEFSSDLETALKTAGYVPPDIMRCTCGAIACCAGVGHHVDCELLRPRPAWISTTTK